MISIRWRTVISFTLVVLFTVAVLSAALFWAIDRYYTDLERRYLAANAQGAAEILSPLLAKGFPLHELEREVNLLALLSQARVRVWSADGTLLADSGARPSQSLAVPLSGQVPPSSSLLTRTLPVTGVIVQQVIVSDATKLLSLDISMHEVPFGYVLAREGGESGAVETLSISTRSREVVRLPVQHAGQVVGSVELCEGPAYSRQIIAGVASALGKAACLAILLGALAGLLIGGKLLSPLLSLTSVVRQMAEGNLAVRATVPGRDETGLLAQQFNTMAEHIQQTVSILEVERESLRRFTADASHEMHTPLTALTSFIELLGGPRGGKPAARAELLAQAEQQVARLNSLTGDLLELTRFDSGTASLALRASDLRVLLRKEVDAHRLQAQACGVGLDIAMPDRPVIARHDKKYLGRALSNLLDNALKFSPAGSRVRVGLSDDGETATLWVADDGPGISARDLPHVFERFYRGCTAQGTPGTGLGLSIVAAVAHMHAGRIAVRSQEGAGAHFTLEIPSGSENRFVGATHASPLRA